MEIAQTIILVRKEKGHTQESLAHAANLSLSTIKRIENGKVNPHIHTLKAISSVLDLELLTHQDDLNNYKTSKESEFLPLLLSILFTLIPPLNIYLLQRSLRKKKTRLLDLTVKKLLVFQIISFLFLILSIFLFPIFSYILTGQKTHGQMNVTLILYTVFIILNISAIYVFYREGKI